MGNENTTASRQNSAASITRLTSASKKPISISQNKIDGMCVKTKEDEYQIGLFLKQFNVTKKFTDSKYNVLNKLDTNEWTKKRIGGPYDPFTADPSSDLIVSSKMYSTGATSCVLNLMNDLQDNYKVYWIDPNGKPILNGDLNAGRTFGVNTTIGHCFAAKNISGNKNDVLVFTAGEEPCHVPNEQVKLSNVLTNVNNLIEKPFMYFNNKSNASHPVVPCGIMTTEVGSTFSFTLINDLNNSYKIYLIDTNGKDVFKVNLDVSTSYTEQSNLNNVYLLKPNTTNVSEDVIFELGKAPFSQSDTKASISQIIQIANNFIRPFIFANDINSSTTTTQEVLKSTEGPEFKCVLKNDLDDSYKAYWIDYNGKSVFYFDLNAGASYTQSSYTNHVWSLKSVSKKSDDLTFTLGYEPFLESGAEVCLSQINVVAENKNHCETDTNINTIEPLVPSGVASEDGGTEFKLNVKNDLTDSYKVYWIDSEGSPKFYFDLNPDSTYTHLSFTNHIWFLKNTNINKQETFFIKLGEVPFQISDKCINLSDLVFTVEDIISESYEICYTSRQGRIGDCYVLQCLISIYAMYPEKIFSIFMFPSKFKETGVVVLKYWNKAKNSWCINLIDDYLPMTGPIVGKGFYGTTASGKQFNEYWVSLLEKGLTKSVGSFPDLEASTGLLTIESLYEMILGPIDFFILTVPENDKDFEFFNTFLNHYNNGVVLSFSSRHSKEVINSKTGLVNYHGYGLLSIVEDVEGTGLTFVKCQNPWSAGGEWKGDWSDSSPLWNKHPNIKSALNFEKKDDGIFWIEKKDFCKAFALVWCAQLKDI